MSFAALSADIFRTPRPAPEARARVLRDERTLRREIDLGPAVDGLTRAMGAPRRPMYLAVDRALRLTVALGNRRR